MEFYSYGIVKSVGNGSRSVAKEGITNPSGERNKVVKSAPSPTNNGSRDELTKERTVDWVARRFGAAREYIKVTTNYSCQEITSQTLDDSSKGIETSHTNTDAKKA